MHQLIFLFFIVAFYILYVRKKIKDRLSKLILDFFSSYWFVALFLSILRIDGLNEVSDYTYFVMYLGLASFILGYSRINIPSNISCNITIGLFEEMINKFIKNYIFLGFLFFSCIYVYFTLIKFFNAVALSGTLSSVRTDFFSGELYGPIFAQINAFILLPFSIITLPIFAYLLFYKRNVVCALLGFFLFGYESLGGGRLGYIKIVLSIIFVLFILLNTYKLHRKKFLRFVSVFFIAIIFLLALVTTLRVQDTESKMDVESSFTELVHHLGTYTAGPIAAFDYSIKHNYLGRFGGFQGGQLTTSSLISMFNLFLSRIDITIPLALEKIVLTKQSDQINIGNSFSYNALYSSNFYFYYDLGLLGVFLFPFLLGLLFRLLIRKMYMKKSFFIISVVCSCFYPLVASVMDFYFVSPYMLLSLLIFIVIGNMKNKYIIHNS